MSTIEGYTEQTADRVTRMGVASSAGTCAVHGHAPIEILNAGVAPQFGLCGRCGQRLNPAHTMGLAELAVALELSPPTQVRGVST